MLRLPDARTFRAFNSSGCQLLLSHSTVSPRCVCGSCQSTEVLGDFRTFFVCPVVSATSPPSEDFDLRFTSLGLQVENTCRGAGWFFTCYNESCRGVRVGRAGGWQLVQGRLRLRIFFKLLELATTTPFASRCTPWRLLYIS